MNWATSNTWQSSNAYLICLYGVIWGFRDGVDIEVRTQCKLQIFFWVNDYLAVLLLLIRTATSHNTAQNTPNTPGLTQNIPNTPDLIQNIPNTPSLAQNIPNTPSLPS